jgi:hypothetical protein
VPVVDAGGAADCSGGVAGCVAGGVAVGAAAVWIGCAVSAHATRSEAGVTSTSEAIASAPKGRWKPGNVINQKP